MQEKRELQYLEYGFFDSLTSKWLLKKINRTKAEILEMLYSSSWLVCADRILRKDEIYCGDVLLLCEPMLNSLSDIPRDGWLKYIYRDSLSRLFPDTFPSNSNPVYEPGRLFYLETLKIFLNYERDQKPFNPKVHLAFPAPEEISEDGAKEEFLRLHRIFRENYFYEFMRIGSEISRYKTLAHICGVHHIAMHMAKQMKQAGIPADLALISGAAVGHDIGKFGCRPEEEKRIPYLHYYYTDTFFKNNNILNIGHIATNHSTWDLELENLSVESLILIYSDFRVKSTKDKNGKEFVNFFSLKDSFDIILNKLDNVDEAKKDRYLRVYAKLKDFEDYMLSLGVNTDLTANALSKAEIKDAALMEPSEVIQSLKFMAIRHNIILMHKFNSDVSFGNLLEAARGEKNWKNIRAYINIFQEYFTYMTQKQKLMTLHFLYELLMHREGDIRRQSAELMGNIIVHYDEEYRKELPEGVQRKTEDITSLGLWEKYLKMILIPDHKVTDQHRRWIGYTLKIIADSVFSRCKKKDAEQYLAVLLEYYQNCDIEDATAFILLDSLLSLPLEICSEPDIQRLIGFLEVIVFRESLEIRIAALRFIKYLSESPDFAGLCLSLSSKLLKIGNDDEVSIPYLKCKIQNNLRKGTSEAELLCVQSYGGRETSPEILLDNLKVATPWVTKAVNIELLLEQVQSGTGHQALQVAAHFSNLIKVSERVAVRHSAGKALVSIAPLLTLDQRNEIAVELTKGLEIGEYEFSKYIPEYLGEFALFLHPNELDELINNFKKLLDSTNDRVGSVTLDTLGIILLHYPAYRDRFPEEASVYLKRRELILGLILMGLSNYQEVWNQEAFLVIGQYIFGSHNLNLCDKYEIFQMIYKKMLTLIIDCPETGLSFFNNAASLNHIYRFLSNYEFLYGMMEIPRPGKAAFFPGTFDPFSLSHKAIINEITGMGYEVYLAIDEFSWSKKMQPKLIRRQIATMSVASEKNVYIFPDDIPVNIGNPQDLLRLKMLFPSREIHIVVGSDVVREASSYLAPPAENSIHSFDHIVFMRSPYRPDEESGTGQGCPEVSVGDLKSIKGDVKILSLPVHVEEISSSQIRENIDYNRDVSNLIDPIAQKYIYDNSLYLREPQFKQILKENSILVQVTDQDDSQLLTELNDTLLKNHINKNQINRTLQKEGMIIIIRDGEIKNSIVGLAAFYLSDHPSSGQGMDVVITGVLAAKETRIQNLEQIILTELLAYCLKNHVTFAVYHDQFGTISQRITGNLERQGFRKAEEGYDGAAVYEVGMKYPVALIDDMMTTIKEPFSKNEKVLEVIKEAHKKFQGALVKLYPGNLVLSFDSDVMQQRMVDIIASENAETSESESMKAKKRLGKSMCVPFGKILRGMAVPGTVTKSLHTEKVFEPEIDRFEIKEFPNYSLLCNQIRTIKSFGRPVLLIDDLLHKGYRMRGLDPILKQEGLEVSKLIVGILSGRGLELMEQQGRQVDSVYFIPNMLSWLSESSMYPFVGGDSVRRNGNHFSGILPSINMVLPYTAPRFLLYVPKKSIYDFSMTCLENTRSILSTLEEEYQAMFERNLTLNRLSEAIISPRYPDKGANISYDFNLPPSVYIANDIEKLIRLKNVIL